MKVRELIEYLKTYDQELDVVMSRDSEGNSYSPLHTMDAIQYIPENTWSGEISDDEPYNAIAFWPVN